MLHDMGGRGGNPLGALGIHTFAERCFYHIANLFELSTSVRIQRYEKVDTMTDKD